jgi:hypothetical protein
LAFLQDGTLCKMLKYIYIYIYLYMGLACDVGLSFLSFFSLMGLNEVVLSFFGDDGSD